FTHLRPYALYKLSSFLSTSNFVIHRLFSKVVNISLLISLISNVGRFLLNRLKNLFICRVERSLLACSLLNSGSDKANNSFFFSICRRSVSNNTVKSLYGTVNSPATISSTYSIAVIFIAFLILSLSAGYELSKNGISVIFRLCSKIYILTASV